jgi:hypothetical protein
MAMHESINRRGPARSSDPAKFGAFVRQAMSLLTEESDKLSFVERTRLLVFFINAIKSLENSVVWMFVPCLSWIWIGNQRTAAEGPGRLFGIPLRFVGLSMGAWLPWKQTNHVQVRAEILPIVSLGIYAHLSDARRARELDQAPRLKKQYALLQKKLAKMSPEEKKVGAVMYMGLMRAGRGWLVM